MGPTVEDMIALIMEVEGAKDWSQEFQDSFELRLLEMNDFRREGMYRACLQRKAEKEA